jgi:hypothetical protein
MTLLGYPAMTVIFRSAVERRRAIQQRDARMRSGDVRTLAIGEVPTFARVCDSHDNNGLIRLRYAADAAICCIGPVSNRSDHAFQT